MIFEKESLRTFSYCNRYPSFVHVIKQSILSSCCLILYCRGDDYECEFLSLSFGRRKSVVTVYNYKIFGVKSGFSLLKIVLFKLLKWAIVMIFFFKPVSILFKVNSWRIKLVGLLSPVDPGSYIHGTFKLDDLRRV